MRQFRRQTKKAEFTWQEPPRLKWRLKFFGSICLFAFMGGLMLGTLLRPAPVENRLLDVRQQGGQLTLCFVQLPDTRELSERGLYALVFENVQGEPLKGRLQLQAGVADWRIQAAGNDLLLSLVSLGALQVGRLPAGDGCIRLDVEL